MSKNKIEQGCLIKTKSDNLAIKYQINGLECEKISSIQFLLEKYTNIQNQAILNIQNLILKCKQMIQQSLIDQSLQNLQLAQKFLKNKKTSHQIKSARLTSPKKNTSFQVSNTKNKIKTRNLQEIILDIYFIKASCLMSKKKYDQSLLYLLQVKSFKINYKQNLSFLMSICYFNLQQYDKALQNLNFDAQIDMRNKKDKLFFRAKINFKMKQYKQSIKDLNIILQKQQNHYASIKMILEVYKIQKSYCQALSLIDHSLLSLQNKKEIKQLLIKKIQFSFLNLQYDQALEIIFNFEKNYKLKDNKLCYLKGKIYLKKLNYQLAIINFNDGITLNNNNIKYTFYSLSELIIHFLKQRDFYGAQKYCQRIQFINIHSQKFQLIENLSHLTQGLILLMKRNFKQGLSKISLTQIKSFEIIHETENKLFLENLFYNAKGFSYFSMGYHKQALKQYEKVIIKQNNKQDYLSCLYNIKLCQGIIAINEENNQERAIDCFQKSINYLIRPQPYYYISVILTLKNLKNGCSTQIFMKILSILQSGLKINATTQIHFYRTLIYMYLGMYLEGLEDIDKTIEISQDNIAQHFYVKGMIYFIQGNLDQAISQFDIGLSIEEKNEKILIEKIKCEIKSDKYQQAYKDLQDYRQMNPIDKDQKHWELILLLYQKKYQQLLKECSKQQYLKNINLLKSTESIQSLQQIKQKANFYLGKFQQAGPAGKLIIALTYKSYQDLITILDQALQLNINIGPLSQIDIKFIKAYILFKFQSYEQSVNIFEQLQRQLTYNSECCENNNEYQVNQFKILIIKINCVLIQFGKGDLQTAKEKLEILINEINQGDILEELKFLYQKLREISQRQNQNVQGCQQQNQILSSHLPPQSRNQVQFHILIPYPILIIQQLIPNNQKMLQQFYFTKIQNKPQAPWIKRGQFGVLFTNQIKEYNNLHLNTEEQIDENNYSHSNQNINSNIEYKNTIQKLKLGSKLLLKLDKLKKQTTQPI